MISRLRYGLGSVGESGEQLHKSLYGRRYLIILDDIWSVEAWDKVRHFFPDNGNRSRVVLTSRLSNVARDCGSSSCFMMKPLEEKLLWWDLMMSWELFCKKAFEQENCPYPKLEKVGKEIARLCRGLPLSTVGIGGLLLKSPRSLQLWENVARNIKSVPDSKEKEESLDILSLSYNHLPPYLKPCFLYMGVFEEDSEIRVSEIIKLWIAEGFLRPNNTKILEDVAEDYLKELIDRNLILVSKRRHNGKIGSCGIHDLLRDLCLRVKEFFHMTAAEIRGTERRLVFSIEHPLPSHNEPQLARSILAGRGSGPPVNHKLPRVWSMGPPTSPAELYGNVNLRYLSFLFLGYRSQLPTSVSLIWNLQTLIIEKYKAYAEVIAPIEIWRMRQLRHVKIYKIYVPPPTSGGLFMMDNLQTLTKVVNFRLSEEVCKIIPNIKKLHLFYHGDAHGYDACLIESLCNLDCLLKLESLKLRIERSNRPTPEIELYTEVRFPSSLNKLSLIGCQICPSMIGSLPQLEVLQLEATLGDEWSPVDGQFLHLKFLEISNCRLTDWNAESSHFPALEKLALVSLCNLEEIPLGIGDIAALELIRVDYCSEAATISAMKIKEDQLHNFGNDGLQVQVRMYGAGKESFKARVEAEGLTINDIQLET